MYQATCIDIISERNGRTSRTKTIEGLVSWSLYGIVSLSDRTPSPLGECSSSDSEV